MKFLIATQNPGKFAEIRAMFNGLESRGHEFVSLTELGITQDCVEDGETFEENALKKAYFYAERSQLPTITDDSGIIVDALKDELGVRTRRWGAGERANDEQWMDYFMKRMELESNRGAEFVCAAAYVDFHRFPKGTVFKGETRGELTLQLEAPIHAGIPLSSVFKPEGMDRVYSQLSFEEKARLSHRGKAFSQLLAFFETIL